MAPKFLERKLEREYPNNPHAIWGTMNKIGAVKGNKETKKGERMEQKHEDKYSKGLKKAGAKYSSHEKALRMKVVHESEDR